MEAKAVLFEIYLTGEKKYMSTMMTLIQGYEKNASN